MTNRNIDKRQIYLDVAKLHYHTLKTGFLPTLGINFLALMYQCIDEANFSILITKYKNSKLIGFVSGSLGSSGLYKLMLNHPLTLIITLAPVIFNFRKIKKIINIFKHISSKERKKYPKPELLSICVHPDHQGKGIGIELYHKLSQYFKSLSKSEFIIVVGQSLQANSFYKNQGAEIIGELKVHPDVKSNIFIQRL